MAEEAAATANSPETNTAPPKEALASTPTTWPGAFGLYKYSREAVRFNLWTLVGIFVATAVVNAVLGAALKDLGDLIGYAVSALATAASSLAYIAGVRRQKLAFGDSFSKGLPFWLKMIGLTILTSIALIVSFVLLVIPFLFVLPRVILAPYYLVDQGLGVFDAFKASWNATKGFSLKIWGTFGAAIAMSLLMLTIIGIPFAIYFLIMYSGVTAVVYEFISKSQPKVVAAPEAPAAAPAV